jgi:hypothetical protein
MDALTQAIIQSMQDLPDREKGKLLHLIMFLHWRKFGGRKTSEICRGEKIYAKLQRVQLTEKAA